MSENLDFQTPIMLIHSHVKTAISGKLKYLHIFIIFFQQNLFY